MTIMFKRVIHVVDSHTEGNPTRVVMGGLQVPPGTTLAERTDWLKRNDDALADRLERDGLEPFLDAWLAQRGCRLADFRQAFGNDLAAFEQRYFAYLRELIDRK